MPGPPPPEGYLYPVEVEYWRGHRCLGLREYYPEGGYKSYDAREDRVVASLPFEDRTCPLEITCWRGSVFLGFREYYPGGGYRCYATRGDLLGSPPLIKTPGPPRLSSQP